MARIFVSVVVLMAVLAAAQSGGKSPSASELPPGSAELIQPEDLVKALQSGQRPTLLYVGPRFLYSQAHIPGAEFIGSAADAEFMDKLRKRVATLPRNSMIVLYCGCCPWEHCPNIRPAYKELQRMGFKGTKALYLANSFGTNWVEKGYPVEKENSGR